MKKALGMVEILLVLIVITAVYMLCFHSKYGRSNPFADNQKIETQQKLVDDKLKDIEDAKALRKRIEQNLNKGY